MAVNGGEESGLDQVDFGNQKLRNEAEIRNREETLLKKNISKFIDECTQEQYKEAAELCENKDISLIHEVFKRVKDDILLYTLDSNKHLDEFDKRKRNWLHLAAIYNRNIKIFKNIIEKKTISIESKDDYKYTPLHYYCQRKKININVLRILTKNGDHLIMESEYGVTPLELACNSKDNLEIIVKFFDEEISSKMKDLLKKFDQSSKGIMEVDTDSIPEDRIWLSLLLENDKYMLLYYIKNNNDFANNKYYLKPTEIVSLIKKCSENGQGILSYVKNKFLDDSKEQNEEPEQILKQIQEKIQKEQEQILKDIFSYLTGIEIEENSEDETFYKSGLFLALITGRFKLISPLLRCCQFEIVPYAMLVCLICKNLASKKKFSDQVVKNISDIKKFCEEFAMAVIDSSNNKDLTKEKTIITEYLNENRGTLYGESIMQIAYYAECNNFLSLPSCQDSITKTWRILSPQCPRIKFWLHSLTHVIFLIFFSYFLFYEIFARASVYEWVCYVYSLGYLVEELRQIYYSREKGKLKVYWKGASNIVDILGLVFMLISFILRISLTCYVYPSLDENTLIIMLFVLRISLSLALIPFFMRVIYFCTINEVLGPKLDMINTMIVKDLFPLLFIFSVFVISFGVPIQSFLFPNSFYTKVPGSNVTFDKKDLSSTVGDIFRRSIFSIFDFHYTLDEIENNHNGYVSDFYGKYAVYIFLPIFMVIVNVMLMNLLIALFSYTVTSIIEKSRLSWKRKRYDFIQEYKKRTLAPPPLNIIVIPIEVLVRLIHKKHSNERSNCEDREMPPLNSTPEELEKQSMPYYIIQALAMKGQRYKLCKEEKDIQYENELRFKTNESNDKKLESIDKKLESNDKKLERIYKILEEIIKEVKLEKKESAHRSILTAASFK